MDNHCSKTDVMIGKAGGTVNAFVSTVGTDHQILSPKGDKVGLIKFVRLSVDPLGRPSFIEYLRAGVTLNLMIAIDFTSSNREVTSSFSLHYISAVPNQYERCIQAVGSIIGPYDTDQRFAVYGFGAALDGRQWPCVNHCFALNGNEEDPYVHGLDGVLSIYKERLPGLGFSGPTNFAPCIKAATAEARKAWNASRTYTVMLILTDGAICDFPETVEALADAADVALSLVIVGVGRGNFGTMNQLDGDGVALLNRKSESLRDLVQFVPFSKYGGQDGARLAAEVLAEIPKQVREFCQQVGFKPEISH
jgi:hypothetical protein